MPSSVARLVCLVLLANVVNAHGQSSVDDRQVATDTRVRGYWVDPSTGLMWAGKDNFGRDLSWRQATEYCRDLRLAGYVDWRLPEIHELQGIHDPTAKAPGLAGPYNSAPLPSHVKGDLFLTGSSWSANRRLDDRGRPSGFALGFDFVNGRRYDGELWFHTGLRALCVRGDVTVDLSLPGLSRVEAARHVGVDYTAPRHFGFDNGTARLAYWNARTICEDGVITRMGGERACRSWVDFADHLVGDPLLDRVYALELHAVSLVSEGRRTEGLTLLDRALVMRRQRYEDDADAADFEVIAALVQFGLGNAAEATALIESAIATYEKEIARPSSLQARYRQRLAAIRKRFPTTTSRPAARGTDQN